MHRLTNGPILFRTRPEVPLLRSCGAYVKFLWVLALAGTMMFSACGGASSGSGSQQSGTLTGNWQFSMSNSGIWPGRRLSIAKKRFGDWTSGLLRVGNQRKQRTMDCV